MRDRLKNLPMQKKMMIVFDIPVALMCILVLAFCYPVLNKNYKEKIEYSLKQSCDQAVLFLDSYMQNMQYLSEMIGMDAELQGILNTEEFGTKRSLSEEYHEFYALRKRLVGMELSNSLFRMGLYVPDDVFYAMNHRFVYPESELAASPEYEEMLSEFQKGKLWCGIGEERRATDTEKTFDTLVMYANVYSTYGNRRKLCVSKVSTELANLRKVLKNANITEQGVTCLLNEKGEVLFSSEEENKRSIMLSKAWKNQGSPQNMEKILLDGQEYYAVCQPMQEAQWQLLALIPTEELAQQGRLVSVVFAIVGIGTILTILLGSWILSRYYVSRLVKLRDKMKELQQGDFNTRFSMEEEREKGDEISSIYHDFNYMAEQLRKLLQEHYRMGKNVKASELKALQAQINPHFLYNTLDLINWTAMDYGAAEIADIAYKLARFYRLSLNHGKNIITIRDELEHVQTYVDIENFHFEQAIHLNVDIDEDIQEMACPNIILQPFVENAIVHGIAEFPEITECNIWINAERTGQDILFYVCDDGKGISKDQMEDILPSDMQKSSKGYGVKNINFRLKLYYGEQYGVSYESKEGEGTFVKVRIPALTLEETEKIINE